MNLKEWNERQIRESQSEMNRYYFSLRYPDVKPTRERLLFFYIKFGGAYDFEKSHNSEKPQDTS